MLFPGFMVKLGWTDKLLIHLSLFLILFISCTAGQLGPDLVGRHSLVLLSLWTFRAETVMMREDKKVTRTGWCLNHCDTSLEISWFSSYADAVFLSLSVFLLSLFKLCCAPVAFVSKTSFLVCYRFKDTIVNAKYGGHTEAVRRLLGQLPISAQSYSGSPYLDLSLFSYDDKWVSVMERPKTCGDHPIRYGRGQEAVCEESSARVTLNLPCGIKCAEKAVDQGLFLLWHPFTRGFISVVPQSLASLLVIPVLSCTCGRALWVFLLSCSGGLGSKAYVFSVWMLLFLLLFLQSCRCVWAAEWYVSGCLLSSVGRIPFEHMVLAGKDVLVCSVNKTAAGLGVIQSACGIDLAIFRLSLFTVLTLGAVLLFIPRFFLRSIGNLFL